MFREVANWLELFFAATCGGIKVKVTYFIAFSSEKSQRKTVRTLGRFRGGSPARLLLLLALLNRMR